MNVFFINIACIQSYGENCQFPCSIHCYNQTCDRVNGRCLLGCKDGFYGELCDRGNEFLLLYMLISTATCTQLLDRCLIIIIEIHHIP